MLKVDYITNSVFNSRTYILSDGSDKAWLVDCGDVEPMLLIVGSRKVEGADRDVLKLRPEITGPATLKYRLEDEMIAEYVAACKAAGDSRPAQDIAVEYNDTVIYPDKVRLNCYYYRNYSFLKDIEMIFATVLGKKIRYAGEEI